MLCEVEYAQRGAEGSWVAERRRRELGLGAAAAEPSDSRLENGEVAFYADESEACEGRVEAAAWA